MFRSSFDKNLGKSMTPKQIKLVAKKVQQKWLIEKKKRV